MGVMIDSGFFITLERRGLPLSAIAQAAPNEPAVTASVVISELLVGVHRADSRERRLRRSTFVEGILAMIPVLPFDLRIARVHAELVAHALTSGQLVGAHDLIIAATALVHGHDVLTENVRDFNRVPGLVVRQPDW